MQMAGQQAASAEGGGGGISSSSDAHTNGQQQQQQQQQQQHQLHHSNSIASSMDGSLYQIDNPTPHRLPEGDNATPLEVIGTTASDKLVIIMVGLPATGKTHIAKRICRFLSFFHDIPSQIFNVGDYRRQLCGAQMPADWYSPDNAEGCAARGMACDAAIADLVDYMKQDGVRVAAFDATNSTQERRLHIVQTLSASGLGAKKMFVESICDQEDLLTENIRKVKLSTPDYRDMDPEQAINDFRRRRENYMSVYVPVEPSEGPSIKIINSRQFIVNNIRGYLPLKVVHFVMNLHTLPRTFYLTRHGQSEYNLLGKIGGDSGLTPAGVEYARRLAQFCKEHIAKYPHDQDEEYMVDVVDGEGEGDDAFSTSSASNCSGGGGGGDDENPKNMTPRAASNLSSATTMSSTASNKENRQRPARLWTSTLRRTKETAQFIEHNTMHHTWDNGDAGEWVQFRPMARRNLDELYAGTCDGMTYKEIEQVYPEEFGRRQADKLSYRYPRGESYMDVTLRLEPLAQEMERTREPVVIVGHQGILRILYAYFMGLDRKEAPYVSIPLNNVIELTPHAYGCHEKRFCLMRKEEMLHDGQDEPVTSMPELGGNLHGASEHSSGTSGGAGGGTGSGLATRTSFVAVLEKQYEPNDPVMNAPSC